LLFLVASGLTFVFGILDVINLAHGALFMVGAHAGALTPVGMGSVVWALIAAPIGALLVGIALDRLVLLQIYDRDHLDQVLARFGCLLFLNELARAVFGPAARPFPLPALLEGSIGLPGGVSYPVLAIGDHPRGLPHGSQPELRSRADPLRHARARGCHQRTDARNARGGCTAFVPSHVRHRGRTRRLRRRDGRADRGDQPGMGDQVLILAFVLIVSGGTGSVRSALAGSLSVGLADTLGRSFLTDLARSVLPPAPAAEFGPAVASMMVYVVMALVLLVKPQGLLPVGGSRR